MRSTVTGRGLSFSAQNRPARPPPTITTSSIAVQDWAERSGSSWHALRTRASKLEETGDPARGRSHQFFRFTMRSTARRARSAIAGSTKISSFMVRRLSRIFGSVMRFMCGQRLQRLDELHVRHLGLDVGRHRAFGDEQDLRRAIVP